MNWDLVQDALVQSLNITLMLSLGLELTAKQLMDAAAQTRLLGWLVVLNVLCLPAVAWLGVSWASIEPAVGAGILVALYAPGGGTGSLLTRLGDGDVAFSVVLLALLTIVAVPVTPMLVAFSTPAVGSAGPTLMPVLKTLALFQLLPFAMGFSVNRFKAPLAQQINRLVRPLSNGIFFVLVVGLLVLKGHLTLRVGWAGVGLSIALVVLSLWAAGLGRQDDATRRAAVFTTCVRNLSLALLLTSSFFGELTMITVLTYGLVMYMVSVPYALYLGRRP